MPTPRGPADGPTGAGRPERKEGADVVAETPSIPGRHDSGKVNALRKGARITGSARQKLTADLRKKYEKGQSIRALADGTGRSYGFVHRLLVDAEVPLRGRGGATRTRKK
jgi:hypothetical protein